MEDYTYHFDGKDSAILQAHMLEVCPLISEHKPKLEVHPLGIGGKTIRASLACQTKEGSGVGSYRCGYGQPFPPDCKSGRLHQVSQIA